MEDAKNSGIAYNPNPVKKIYDENENILSGGLNFITISKK